MKATRITIKTLSDLSLLSLQSYGLSKLLPFTLITHDIKGAFTFPIIPVLYGELVDYNILPHLRWYDIPDYYVVPFIFTVVLLFAIVIPGRLFAYHPSLKSGPQHKNSFTPLFAQIITFSDRSFFLSSQLFFKTVFKSFYEENKSERTLYGDTVGLYVIVAVVLRGMVEVLEACSEEKPEKVTAEERVLPEEEKGRNEMTGEAAESAGEKGLLKKEEIEVDGS